ncbi:MAG: RND transporter [Chromatiales bacterium]|nr:RND transporter [Chromatiales bacterium]
MKWLDSIPLPTLVMASLLLGLAPFVPEPHLFEKIGMLFSGTLHKPIDIFDLVMHGTPALLLMLKLTRVFKGNVANVE